MMVQLKLRGSKFFNPPVLVDDSNGDIIRESTNSLTNELIVRKLRRDPAEALRSVIAHNIHIYGKLNTQIIKNKVGNTTATFFPDAHPESSSVDGFTMSNLGGSFASNRSGAGNSSNDSATNDTFVAVRGVGSSDGYCHRLITLFNTSLLGNSTITSATYSLYATAVGTVNSPTFALVGCTPASNTAIVNADFTATTLNSPTEYITRIAISSFNIGSYTDMALNANGLAAISKNGITKFMGREGKFDVDNTDPNTSSTLHLDGYFADETGTTKDPKLTVVYTKLSDFLGYFF
jgi:hypothetical protein